MTDRMLSAEKVKAFIADNKFHDDLDQEGTPSSVANTVVDADEFQEAIDSGQLDADRPKCPKCGGTGETIVGEHARWADRCDCKTSK